MGVVTKGAVFMAVKVAPSTSRAYCAPRLAVMRTAHNLAGLESRSTALLLRHRGAWQPESGGGTPSGFAVDADAADARARAGSRRPYFRAQRQWRGADVDGTCIARWHAAFGRAFHRCTRSGA